MRASFVLHLDTTALAAGELRGDIEEVGSGRRAAIRAAEDLTAFLTGPPAASPDGEADAGGGVSPQ